MATHQGSHPVQHLPSVRAAIPHTRHTNPRQADTYKREGKDCKRRKGKFACKPKRAAPQKREGGGEWTKWNTHNWMVRLAAFIRIMLAATLWLRVLSLCRARALQAKAMVAYLSATTQGMDR